MAELTIKITPGGDVYFLYDDNHPLRGMGKMKLSRASNVIWNDTTQKWFIQMLDGKLIGSLHGYDERMMAIADEIAILSQMLIDGSTMPELGFKEDK